MWQPFVHVFWKKFSPLLCLSMHGSFQLKFVLVYQKQMWQITIGSFQLENDKKHMLGVSLKNINRPFTQE
jgi:hypothetical protein